MSAFPHLVMPSYCPCPGCRVLALRDHWREDEAPESETESDEARAELAEEATEAEERC